MEGFFKGSATVKTKKNRRKGKPKSVLSELKDFEVKYKPFSLQIQAEAMDFQLEFNVIHEGEIPMLQRAKRTAIALFAIVQYGTEADGFNSICDEFGGEYIEQLLGVHEQVKGQKFLGHLTGGGLRIATCASHPGMIDDERVYNSERAIAELKA